MLPKDVNNVRKLVIRYCVVNTVVLGWHIEGFECCEAVVHLNRVSLHEQRTRTKEEARRR